jgi:hypothetical protein
MVMAGHRSTQTAKGHHMPVLLWLIGISVPLIIAVLVAPDYLNIP